MRKLALLVALAAPALYSQEETPARRSSVPAMRGRCQVQQICNVRGRGKL
jgi:hypothetical protein